MRRRLALGLLAGAGLVTVGLVFSPAYACHFGGPTCTTPPEAQPYNPQTSVTLTDNRTSAHSGSTFTISQALHEQFTAHLTIDFPKEAGIDLDMPALNEKLADITIKASLNGADTTLTGRIKDHNDPAHGHPSGGVYHWVVEIDSTTPGMPPTTVDSFVDKNAADGHFHFAFDAPLTLIEQAQLADASLKELKTTFFGTLAGGPFLTNPAAAGTYTIGSTFTAWDDPTTPATPPTVSRTATFTIVNRIPSSVTVAPTSGTKRVGTPHTLTATVKDQAGETLAGATVDWSVTGANSASGSSTTNSAGQATFTYSGTHGGNDTITATATKFGTSVSASASMHWLAPTTVTVAPATANKRVGESHTVTATVKDNDGNTMAGETVVFTVTGANSAGGSATTNASGQAQFTYSGSTAGDDTVTATDAPASAGAAVTWYVPVASSIDLQPATASPRVNQSQALTATVQDQKGRVLSGVAVSFTVTGANSASGSDTTDSAGVARFAYTGTHEGNDTVTATAGSVSDTSTISWGPAINPTPQDQDGDGIINTSDNCPSNYNPDQADNDGDHIGNVCDSDDDNDSLQDVEEAPNGCDAFKRDTDSDGLTDWQEVKGSWGTRCNNPDTDGDGASDGREVLSMGTSPTNPDSDGDGVRDGTDNCPRTANADQRDSNANGVGDACESGIHLCLNGTCPAAATDPRRLVFRF